MGIFPMNNRTMMITLLLPLSGVRRTDPFLGVQILPLDAGSPDAFPLLNSSPLVAGDDL